MSDGRPLDPVGVLLAAGVIAMPFSEAVFCGTTRVAVHHVPDSELSGHSRQPPHVALRYG